MEHLPWFWALILCPPASWRETKNWLCPTLCCWHHQDLCRGFWSVSSSKCPLLCLNSGINWAYGSAVKIGHLAWILCLISCHQSISKIIRSLKFWELFLPFRQGYQHAQPQKDKLVYILSLYSYVCTELKKDLGWGRWGNSKDISDISRSGWLPVFFYFFDVFLFYFFLIQGNCSEN